jgi:hypothetical protein
MTDDTVTLKGTHLYQDYMAAHRLNRRTLRLGLRVASVAIGALTIALEAIASGPSDLLSVLAGAFFVAWGLFLSDVVFRLRVRRRWKQYPAAQSHFLDLTLCDDGLFGVDDVGNSTVSKWERFSVWKESKDIFLLYMSPRLWLTLPKRLLQPGDVEVARRILSAHVATG